MAELRPKIVKLAKTIGGLTGMVNKIDENAPEYYCMAAILTDDEADVATACGLRHERTTEYLAKKVGKPIDEVQKIAEHLAWIGIFRWTTDPGDGKDRWWMQIFAPGIMEMLVNNQELLAQHPEVARAFEEYTRIRMATLAPMIPDGYGLMRVIPVEDAIKDLPGVNDYERISYYLDKYDIFSVAPCSCRASRRVIGEGCGHLEEEMCVQMGKGAEHFIRTGRARQITKEEALAIIKRAEENGLMHDVTNIDGEGGSLAICNCCSCSCFGLRVGMLYGARDVIRSNFVAEIDEEKCVACGQCVENCPGNALKLGQKLCTKTPLPAPNYKKLSNSLAWSKKDWNVDYRTNREDTVETGTAPCKTACPAHVAVQGYLRLAAQGKYRDALELIKKENPFPAVCGRICNKPCEEACTRGIVDSAVAIDDIKKFIAEKDLNAETRYVPKMLNQRNIPFTEKIAVIGAGPAGMSCAYYLACDGYKVTVFDKNTQPGGMLRYGIPSFRLEKGIIDAEIDVLKQLGVEFRCGVEVGKDVTIAQLREQGFEGFYLGIGAQKAAPLGIPGEDLPNVRGGIDFLREVNAGKSPELGKGVVVVGGGNVAMDASRVAKRLGAEHVYITYRRGKDELPARKEEVEHAEAEGIEFNLLNNPVAIIGDENGNVTGIELVRQELGEPDEKGRRKPVPVEGSNWILEDIDTFDTRSTDYMEWGAPGEKEELIEILNKWNGHSFREIIDAWTQTDGSIDALVECARAWSYDVEYDDEELERRLSALEKE